MLGAVGAGRVEGAAGTLHRRVVNVNTGNAQGCGTQVGAWL